MQVIRQSNPERSLVSGPGVWNGIKYLLDLKLPEEDRNIIVEIHYYSPHHFTHQGASWSKGSEEWLGTTWRGEPDQKQAIIDDFKIATDWAVQNNRPLYLGEFGVYKKADMESRVQWLTYVVDLVEKNNISWSIWDLMGDSFGIFDQEKNEWITPLKNAILPSRN
jgi:endoglucanase